MLLPKKRIYLAYLINALDAFVYLPKYDMNYLFIFLLQIFFKKPLELEATGTAQFNISPTAIGNIFVPLPPSPNRSASPYLDKKCARIDALLEEKQALLDKLAEYKKSLIFECVTGKREVPSCWNR